MLEQDIASLIKFILDGAGNPSPYYWNAPESFSVPAIYFPTPEISTSGDTFSTYGLDYVWNIVFFHRSTQEAYQLALQVLMMIRANRNMICVIDTEGNSTKEVLRVDDPKLKTLDTSAVQLEITWTSRRPYNVEAATYMQSYHVNMWKKHELYESKVISAAMEAALEKYIQE